MILLARRHVVHCRPVLRSLPRPSCTECAFSPVSSFCRRARGVATLRVLSFPVRCRACPSRPRGQYHPPCHSRQHRSSPPPRRTRFCFRRRRRRRRRHHHRRTQRNSRPTRRASRRSSPFPCSRPPPPQSHPRPSRPRGIYATQSNPASASCA